MATNIQEKLKAFRQMFGGTADAILSDAEKVEKEADGMGAQFKEADTTPETLKAKKPAAQVEIEIEAEEEEMPEDEMTEEETEEEEAPVKAKKDDDDTDFDDAEDEEFDAEALGLMDVKEYGALMADVLEAGLLAPIQQELQTIKEALIAEFRETVATHKERQDEGMRLAADAAVDHESRLEVLEKENKALKAALKELQGDLPRGYSRGYIASEAEDNIIPDGDERLKEGPTSDPLATFADQFILTGIK